MCSNSFKWRVFQRLDYGTDEILESSVPGMAEGLLPDQCCESEYINCGLPVDRARLSNTSRCYWMAFSPPNIEGVTGLNITKRKRDGTRLQANFTLNGPPRAVVVFCVPATVNLVRWSLLKGTNATNYDWRGYTCYLITFLKRQASKPRKFWMEFDIDAKHEGVGLTASVSFHYDSGPAAINEEFRQLLAAFPEWTLPTAWTVDHKGYEFVL